MKIRNSVSGMNQREKKCSQVRRAAVKGSRCSLSLFSHTSGFQKLKAFSVSSERALVLKRGAPGRRGSMAGAQDPPPAPHDSILFLKSKPGYRARLLPPSPLASQFGGIHTYFYSYLFTLFN